MTQVLCDSISGTDTEEHLIQSLYDILPEDGATLLLLNREGVIRTGFFDDSISLNHLSATAWEDIVMRLDDGDDPVITGSSDCTLVATELPCPLGPWAYAVVLLPQRSVDSALQSFDLIQMILGQIGLICSQV